MLLAIDIGNSAVKGGLFDGTHLVSTFRIAHQGGDVSPILDHLRGHTTGVEVSRIAVASVVPTLTEALSAGLQTICAEPLTIVSSESELPIRLEYDDPSRLGSDRIAASVAAYALAPARNAGNRPLVVIDAGTAVTFNVVDPKGVFRGGLIWVGPDLVLRALHGGTAQLPHAGSHGTPRPIATDTESALYGGAMFGFVEGSRGIVRRIADGLGAMPAVFVTGGRGEALLEALVNPILEPHLVLHGIRIVAELNAR
ncbi:MAG TPA: type III pantothenate kinase [Rhodothermales bacterium]